MRAIVSENLSFLNKMRKSNYGKLGKSDFTKNLLCDIIESHRFLRSLATPDMLSIGVEVSGIEKETMQGNRLYVGNLPYKTDDEALKAQFSAAGSVSSAKVIRDRDTGRSKGFGFVEFATDAEANKAIEMFNGQEMEGRKLVVNVARPMTK